MNRFKAISIYLVFAVTLIVPRAPLFAAPPPAKHQEGRLLFLIETSSATDNDRTAIRKSLRSIVESGLDGHMQFGDTIGVWTYGEKVNTDFPMVMWTHEHLQDVENAIDFWMTKQRFKGRANFTNVLAPLQKVINASEKLTIIWYSSGDGQITGTPYDKEIAELHKEFRDNFRKQHIPFATLLAVRQGRVVDFTVNPGDSKLRLPDVFAKEDAAAAATATNIPPPQASPPPVAKKPPLIIEVGPSPELIAAKKKTNAPAPAVTNSTAVTNTAAQKPLTNAVAVAKTTAQSNAPASTSTTVPAPTAKPVAPAPTNVAAAIATTTNAPVAIVAKTNPAPVAAAVPTHTNNTAKPAPVAKKAKTTPAIAPQATPAVVSPQLNYTYIALGGAILVLLAVVIVLLVKKSSVPSGPSFISQSMTRERLNSDASKPSSDKPAGPE